MAQACGSISTATTEYSIHLAWLIASGKHAGDESGQLDSPPCFLAGLSGRIWALSPGSRVQEQCEGGATPGHLAATRRVPLLRALDACSLLHPLRFPNYRH